MATKVEITCDTCGQERPTSERPKTWWSLEQQSAKQTTGPLDFCSLPCLAAWVTDPRVTQAPAYAADFTTQGEL